ncbi:MBL fold metallo-hydrolase [Soehngenia saccharolytica]|nr:MBL fold metallo-hydrolase [Soehngenia saccharolytica]
MRIKIHRGQDQIGGSIIEISDNQTSIIFDVGLELDNDEQDIPQIEGLFIGEPKYSAVFISHYHADHLGLAQYLLPSIDLFMGEKSFLVNRFVNEYMHKASVPNPSVFTSESTVNVGDISITPLLCDHSAFDSYMFLIKCDGKTVLYTGDYRANGRKSFSALLKRLPEVDVLITEGTTLSREYTQNKKEEDLERLAVENIGNNSPIFFLQAATNIDRIVTAYKASRKSELLFLEDLYMAGITSIIGGSIPNPKTFKYVKVFMTGNSDERYNQLLEYGDKRIGRKEISQNRFAMCVRPSIKNYLNKLSEEISFDSGVLFYSMWSGYKEKKDMMKFLDFMKSKGVKIITLHTSGHADAETIKKLINKTSPKWILPVHTENAAWFKTFNINVLINSDSLNI